jgi:hypothetical protein
VTEKEARDKVGQALRDAIKIIRSTSRKTTPDRLVSNQSDAKASSASVDKSPKPKRRKRAMNQGDKQQKKNDESSLGKDMWGMPVGRVDGSGTHVMSSRFFENQAQSLGTFPFGSGTIGVGKVDDLDGLMSTMLESSIEPIDTGDGQKRKLSGFDSSSLPSLSALNFASEGLYQSYADMLNGTFKKNPPMEARMPRHQETPSEFQQHLGGASSAMTHPGMYLAQQQQQQQQQQYQQQQHQQQQGGNKQGIVGPWDLEPTPLGNGMRDASNSSEQRASALAHLIWSEERNSS